MDYQYDENGEFISIDCGLYTPIGFLDVGQTAQLLSKTPNQILAQLSQLNIIYLLTSYYTKYSVVRINTKALEDNVIRLRPTFNDMKECPVQQILISSGLIEYIKTLS